MQVKVVIGNWDSPQAELDNVTLQHEQQQLESAMTNLSALWNATKDWEDPTVKEAVQVVDKLREVRRHRKFPWLVSAYHSAAAVSHDPCPSHSDYVSKWSPGLNWLMAALAAQLPAIYHVWEGSMPQGTAEHNDQWNSATSERDVKCTVRANGWWRSGIHMNGCCHRSPCCLLSVRSYLTALSLGPHWQRCTAKRKATLPDATLMQPQPWHRACHVHMPSS